MFPENLKPQLFKLRLLLRNGRGATIKPLFTSRQQHKTLKIKNEPQINLKNLRKNPVKKENERAENLIFRSKNSLWVLYDNLW